MKKLVLLLLFLTIPFIAFAQTAIGFNGVGGQVGYIMPEGDIENTIGFGANADLGSINEIIKINAYVDFWGKSYNVGSYYDFSWNVISIAVVGKYEFTSSGKFIPYAGGGLGLNINSWESKYTGPTYGGYLGDLNTSDSSSEIAIHLVGGASMPLTPQLNGFAEVRYTISDPDYFGIYAGVTYMLSK